MAVKIRLRRMGYKKHPFYRVIVADSRSPRDGRFIEEIGTYDPNQEPSVVKIDEEAAKKWLQTGAQPTESAACCHKGNTLFFQFLYHIIDLRIDLKCSVRNKSSIHVTCN